MQYWLQTYRSLAHHCHKKVGLVVFYLLLTLNGKTQNLQLTLQVLDEKGLPVAGANIQISQERHSCDSLGNIAFQKPKGIYFLSITAVDFFSYQQKIDLQKNEVRTIILKRRESLLSNVTVYASRNISRNQAGVQIIQSEQIKKLPVILGEVDPLKSITLLPGVKNGGEASAGIYVRGGGPDQNLVLLDGVQVYNPNHLFGFFSIFNGDAIQSVEVIKGGMPAEYGGRLSSVINMKTREGNKDSIAGSGGIGLIATRLSLEGPLLHKHASFIISARRTYIDQIAKAVAKKQIGNNGYFFYDLNGKADFHLGLKNELSLNFYSGSDHFTFSRNNDGRTTNFDTDWGNQLFGLQWKQQLSKKIKQQTSIIINRFSLDSKFGFGTINFVFTSGLQDKQINSNWIYQPNNWMKIKWGATYTWHQFKPGAGGATVGVQEFKSLLSKQFAQEGAIYAQTDINLFPNLNLITGLRYSYFKQTGPTKIIEYGSDGIPTGNNISYRSGETIASYANPEPRLSLLYKTDEQSSIKSSFSKTVQYLHLATTSSASFPSDLWVPSGRKIKPGIALQYTLGYFRNFNNNLFEWSVEAYFKKMDHQIEFKPGAQLLLNQNLEGEMIFGTGKAYGIELFLQKRRGKLTGWIGYTLSRTERRFDALNHGKTFVYKYDRTHDVSIVATYLLNQKWEASAVFIYGTGNALTLPTGRFTYNVGYNAEEMIPMFTNVNQYGSINDYRMPAYHRLDIAFTYTPQPKNKKRFKSSWNFSIYNIYNRANPYFIYFDTDDAQQTIQAKKVFLFPVVPSVTWNFKF